MLSTKSWSERVSGGAILALILGACLAFCPVAKAESPASRPNVVLLVCDDLNDFVTGLGGHPQAQTPHLKRLAATAVSFEGAYCSIPVCAPSRASFLTGIHPRTSGNYGWTKWYEQPVLRNCKSLMEYFKENGYRTFGSGKLMHHELPAARKSRAWTSFARGADYGPFAYDGKQQTAHPSVPMPFAGIGRVDGSFGPLSDIPYHDSGVPLAGWVYGGWVPKGQSPKPFHYTSETERSQTPDEQNAAWAEHVLKTMEQSGDRQPFLLAVGFIRPHTPLHAPKTYFDRFPLETLSLPVRMANDAEDTHLKDVSDPVETKGLRYYRLLGESYPTIEDGLKAFTQAYLACIAAVDDCIGRVIDAVDRSPFRDNTIVVVTSDHGWNMGEKDWLFKNTLWEESTRVPLIIPAPGVSKPGTTVAHPVSLIDLYPTLVDLCGLESDTWINGQGAPLDGYSLRPFLADPEQGTWDGPEGALSVVSGGPGSDPADHHWSLRTARWRYIRYNNGSEELYDHDTDPNEWTNLATEPRFDDVKDELRKKMEGMIGLARQDA
ncbi:MAG: sulfatase [Verrucomicrobia bacterium]|nr:sulfatase [Kiritimatiellia bacterium]MCP5488129.1 sulfatase [Verrucomicrobiota bacterium]